MIRKTVNELNAYGLLQKRLKADTVAAKPCLAKGAQKHSVLHQNDNSSIGR